MITLEGIIEKLGFDPREYRINPDELKDYEDDSRVSPFSKLTLEELYYLKDNNYVCIR